MVQKALLNKSVLLFLFHYLMQIHVSNIHQLNAVPSLFENKSKLYSVRIIYYGVALAIVVLVPGFSQFPATPTCTFF